MNKEIETKAINSIRILSADAIQKANSGHPGLPLGAAPSAYTLWAQHLHFDPTHLDWENRDRFVLSAGHGSMLLYSLLHLFSCGLKKEDLMSFRQMGSLTPGHPEYGHTRGVDATTGPLGAGMAMAVAAALDSMQMNEIVGCIAGDDTIMAAIRSVEDTVNVMERIRKLVNSKNE